MCHLFCRSEYLSPLVHIRASALFLVVCIVEVSIVYIFNIHLLVAVQDLH
jgi:hypothetical protein